MGSGGLIVMDDRTCMVDIARYFLKFTRDESCGKCVPCRMGTQHLLRILTDICEGRGAPEQIQQLRLIADTVKKGSLCGLGRNLPQPCADDAAILRRRISGPCRGQEVPCGCLPGTDQLLHRPDDMYRMPGLCKSLSGRGHIGQKEETAPDRPGNLHPVRVMPDGVQI